MKTAADVAERFAHTAACCSNLAFLNVLLADLARLAPVISLCLAKGYTNLSFVYTTCLPDKDPSYGAVRGLWADLTRFLGESTVASRKAFYREAFANQIDRHFGFVADLTREAAITKDKVALANADLTGLIDQKAAEQGAKDFAALERSDHVDARMVDDLPLASGYAAVAQKLAAYANDKESLTRELDRAIPALLRELGIPAAKAVNEIQQARYQPALNTLLQPGPTGSTAVRQFLASDAFGTARRGFEPLLLDAIRNYNTAHPTEKVFTGSGDVVTNGPVTGALEQLAGILWNVDAVGRQEVSFDPRFGSLNTLCPYKDRPATGAENRDADAFGSGELLGAVIRRHTDPGKWRTLLHLFKHFAPQYPQFAYEQRYDLNWFKAEVLNKL